MIFMATEYLREQLMKCAYIGISAELLELV